MHSSTDSHFRSVCKRHIWLLLWHAFVLESCLEEQPHSHRSPPSLAVDVQVKQRMTGRGTEPGPALVLLIQDTDSEEFLGKGRFSHIPDLLMHSLMLDTSKPIPQEHPYCIGSRAWGRTPGQPFPWRTTLAAESRPRAQQNASAALTTQHVLLMFCCANQPADSFNTLAL